MPWFWSDQGSLRLQSADDKDGDEEIRLGLPDAPTWVRWREDCVCGVSTINAPRDFVQLKRLIVGRPTLTPEQLSTPGANIRSLMSQAQAT